MLFHVRSRQLPNSAHTTNLLRHGIRPLLLTLYSLIYLSGCIVPVLSGSRGVSLPTAWQPVAGEGRHHGIPSSASSTRAQHGSKWLKGSSCRRLLEGRQLLQVPGVHDWRRCMGHGWCNIAAKWAIKEINNDTWLRVTQLYGSDYKIDRFTIKNAKYYIEHDIYYLYLTLIVTASHCEHRHEVVVVWPKASQGPTQLHKVSFSHYSWVWPWAPPAAPPQPKELPHLDIV